jgi:hypothetical protein
VSIFISFYLESCFGFDAISRWIRQRNSIKFCANLRMSEIDWLDRRLGSMLIISFNIKEIVDKEFVLAGQTVNSVYYCDVLRRLLEDVRRLRLELCRQKKWLLHHDNAQYDTSFSTREFLTKYNMTISYFPPPHFSLFSPTEDWSIWRRQTPRDHKRWDRWRVKSRACSSYPLTSRGLFIKNSSW